jgi:glycine/D-amino acid oxidase-like deaminating enzyme
MVQRLDGGLTIGDTHEYDEPFGFDVDEDAYDHLRARAEALLGAPLPRTQRRWAGVYSEVVQPSAASSSALYHRSQAAPGVVLVTGPGGRGMTCSPAIAEETFRD